MILSVSRRTDIPACYWQWFLNRLDAGFLCVRNPFNLKQISRIDLAPEVLDCIVFWTKDPRKMIGTVDKLAGYCWYAQVTLTGYGKDMEPGLPDKMKVLVPAFLRLADRRGPERMVWRYDPILINDKYTADYHIQTFGEIARRLRGSAGRVVISFVDLYQKNEAALRHLGIKQVSAAAALELASQLRRIAEENQMTIQSCAEKLDLRPAGIPAGACIDRSLVERLSGYPIGGGKDKNQRLECGCLESIDAGPYDTCRIGCKYCYAVKNGRLAGGFDEHSPLLCGRIGEEDKVSLRKVESLKMQQVTMW